MQDPPHCYTDYWYKLWNAVQLQLACFSPQCRTLHKQLNHSVALRNKMAQDLQISTETIQQLQVELQYSIYAFCFPFHATENSHGLWLGFHLGRAPLNSC